MAASVARAARGRRSSRGASTNCRGKVRTILPLIYPRCSQCRSCRSGGQRHEVKWLSSCCTQSNHSRPDTSESGMRSAGTITFATSVQRRPPPSSKRTLFTAVSFRRRYAITPWWESVRAGNVHDPSGPLNSNRACVFACAVEDFIADAITLSTAWLLPTRTVRDTAGFDAWAMQAVSVTVNDQRAPTGFGTDGLMGGADGGSGAGGGGGGGGAWHPINRLSSTITDLARITSRTADLAADGGIISERGQRIVATHS